MVHSQVRTDKNLQLHRVLTLAGDTVRHFGGVRVSVVLPCIITIVVLQVGGRPSHNADPSPMNVAFHFSRVLVRGERRIASSIAIMSRLGKLCSSVDGGIKDVAFC